MYVPSDRSLSVIPQRKRDCCRQPGDFDAFGTHEQLETLAIYDCWAMNANLTPFRNCKALKGLTINACTALEGDYDATFPNWIQHHPSITLPAGTLKPLADCKNLELLDLHGCVGLSGNLMLHLGAEGARTKYLKLDSVQGT